MIRSQLVVSVTQHSVPTLCALLTVGIGAESPICSQIDASAAAALSNLVCVLSEVCY